MVFITIAFALIPAVTEEFLCRSVFLSEYQSMGMGTAVFFSALLFSFLHFNIHAFPVYFFSGLILIFMGLIGEYLGRIFLGMCNNPQYVVRRIDEHGSAPFLENENGDRFYAVNKENDKEDRS